MMANPNPAPKVEFGLAEALEQIGLHYGVTPPSAGDLAATVTFVAEAVAAILIEVKPQAVRSERPGRQS